jgi:hypothetical protein
MLPVTMSRNELPVNSAVDAAARARLFEIAARLAEVRKLSTKPYVDAISSTTGAWRRFGMHAVADTAFQHELIVDLLRQFDAVATAAQPFTACEAAGVDTRCGTCKPCRLARVLEAQR